MDMLQVSRSGPVQVRRWGQCPGLPHREGWGQPRTLGGHPGTPGLAAANPHLSFPETEAYIIYLCVGAYAGRGRTDVKKTKEATTFVSEPMVTILCALLPRPCFGDGYFEPFQSKVVPL